MVSGVVASNPASTGSATPEIQRDSSLARNTAAHATSQAVPSVPSGTVRRRNSRYSCAMLLTIEAYR